MRILLGLVLLAIFTGIGYYFGQASVPRAFVPPPDHETAIAHRARTAEPAVPDPPKLVNTGSGAAPAPVAAESRIGLPIANLKSKEILDTFDQARDAGERRHEATDIMAPRGTPILAVTDGQIKKLFTSKPGGLTIYEYDPAGEYCYYYAHLDRYADGLHEGMTVKRGDLIAYVGSTGNADPNAPHLHFAILKLGQAKEWWRDTVPVNPYPLLLEALSAR